MLDVVFRKEMTPIAPSTPYQGGVAFHPNRHRGERNSQRQQSHHNGVAGEPPHGPSPWRCWHKPKQTVAITSHHGAANTPQRRFTKPHQKPKPGRCHVNHFANTDIARLGRACRHRDGRSCQVVVATKPCRPPPRRWTKQATTTGATAGPLQPRHCRYTSTMHTRTHRLPQPRTLPPLQPCSSGHPGL